jgi:hypothetical protein
MKNFDDFSRDIKINESELRFVNENDDDHLDHLAGAICTHLEDNDIQAAYVMKPDKSVDIEVGGETYNIKREGTPPRFVLTSKHNEPETLTSGDLMSWWASFVPQHKHGEAEYNMGESSTQKFMHGGLDEDKVDKVFNKFKDHMDSYSRTSLEDALKKEYPHESTGKLIDMADEISKRLEKTDKFKPKNETPINAIK